MSSVVVELQREAIDRNVPVSDILRKAFFIARKLGLKEFEDWTSKELNAYKAGEEIPEYRVIECQLKGLDQYNGWLPIQTNSYTEKFSRRVCWKSIAELESLIASNDPSALCQQISQKMYQYLCNILDESPTEIVSITPPTALIRILESVRNIILNWSFKLEEDGILGEGLSFSSTEKQTASERAYPVTNFYRPDQSTHFHAEVSRSNIAIHSTDVHQSLELPDDLPQLFHQMVAALQADTSLNEAERSELVTDVETLKAELKRTYPRRNIVGTLISTLGDVSSITSFIIQIAPHIPQLINSIHLP